MTLLNQWKKTLRWFKMPFTTRWIDIVLPDTLFLLSGCQPNGWAIAISLFLYYNFKYTETQFKIHPLLSYQWADRIQICTYKIKGRIFLAEDAQLSNVLPAGITSSSNHHHMTFLSNEKSTSSESGLYFLMPPLSAVWEVKRDLYLFSKDCISRCMKE